MMLASAWLAFAAAILLADRVTAGSSPPVRMGAQCIAVVQGLKLVVAVVEARLGRPRPTPSGWLGFLLLWPGTRPSLFAPATRTRGRGVTALVVRGVGCGTLGALLLAAAVRLRAAVPCLAWLVLLIGGSLVVHFGLLRLLTAAWRAAMVPCPELFRAPLCAQSPGEFWGRRWNVGFAEMATLALFRPLCARGPRAVATGAVFLFSGLVHEVLLSVPVRAGYGGPTLYFALQGVLVAAGWEPRGGRLRRRLWTLLALTVPLPLLFSTQFTQAVLWPLAASLVAAARLS